MIEYVLKVPGFWEVYGPNNDTVLSSRIRLARNMRSISFPHTFDEQEASIIKYVAEKFTSESVFNDNLFIDINKLDSFQKRLLRERNIITSEMELSKNSSVIINLTNEFLILINEEDHFRIQVIKPGLQLHESYKIADKVDDELNNFVNFAFSDEYGFLSACPTNLGTGMKASVLMHLPVITMKKKISEIVESSQKNGIEIKSINGEKTTGSIFQVSNKLTLGLSEVDILEILDEVVNKIIFFEDSERDELMSRSRIELEDRVWRSYGILTRARKLSFVEALEHLSNLRLGVVLAIIKNIHIQLINSLMVNIQWSHLQFSFNKKFINMAECDEYRAEFMRGMLQ